MIPRTRTIRDVAVPTFVYGTAWKKERTAPLVGEALAAGFRGFDTANQPRHYEEAGVGRALARSFDGEGPGREDLFVQTKFTYSRGQDHRVPYDPSIPVGEQVAQSFRSSLEHLGLERIDSYLLHGPSRPRGLGDADREAWRAMESLHESGRARLLGVSNFGPEQLEELCDFSRARVTFVQNRCFARAGWDRAVRRVCEARGIVYQAFSLLTANPEALGHPVVREIARRHERTVPQVVFRFALEIGLVPLTGTSDPRHMEEDLEVYDFQLESGEVRAIEGLKG